jgi:hypothetical protein
MAVITAINSILGASGEAPTPRYRVLGSPGAPSATGVHAAIALTSSPQAAVTTGITSPTTPRNVTAKGNASGNTGNVVITGTDEAGNTITETIALNGATEVAGLKVFKTVTSIALPAETHAGTDTVSIGKGSRLGLGVKLSRNSISNVYLNGVKDSQADMAFDATNIYGNYVALTSTLNGTPVSVDFLQ